MNSQHQQHAEQTTDKLDALQHKVHQPQFPDDRYPGTFFRVPGVPVPGKTAWSLSK